MTLFTQGNQKAVIVLSVLAIAGSGLAVWWMQRSELPRIRVEDQSGAAMPDGVAEETAKLLGDRGSVVIVAVPGPGRPPASPTAKAFETKLKTLGSFTVLATEWVSQEEASNTPSRDWGLSSARYHALIARYPHTDAIVSFVGLPYLGEEDLSKLPEKLPLFVAVAPGEINPFQPQRLFEQHVVQMLVVPRIGPASGPGDSSEAAPANPREAFERNFLVITHENLGELNRALGW